MSLEPGDIAYIPEGVERAVRNAGDTESNLVVQITPPQIDLYVDHGFYDEVLVINHDAADKALRHGPHDRHAQARFEYRETHPEVRSWRSSSART